MVRKKVIENIYFSWLRHVKVDQVSQVGGQPRSIAVKKNNGRSHTLYPCLKDVRACFLQKALVRERARTIALGWALKTWRY